MGRVSIARRVLAKFLETTPSDIELLRQAVVEQLVEQVALIAHRVKGAALATAAGPLAAEASRLEELARGRQLQLLEEQLAQLCDTFEWTRLEVTGAGETSLPPHPSSPSQQRAPS
jgi:HPt (histidine-containing phosphotransfer) domain-containing protein